MANMLIPALASTLLIPARIPVSPKSSGPSIFRQLQPLSAMISAGIFAGIPLSWQTIESSSVVRVTEKKSLPYTHEGILDLFSSLKMANLPSRILKVSLFCFIQGSFLLYWYFFRVRVLSGFLFYTTFDPKTIFLTFKDPIINF